MSDADLRDLDAFAAVARHRNFRRAAVELRVSVSTLSQRLSDLEARLGVRLLNRTTRSVAPTEAGERLVARVGPALRELYDAVGDIRSFSDRPSGRLRINAPAPAIDHVLAPMVAPFLQQFPGINLEIVAEPSLIDIVDGGFDAGIRYEEHLDQDMIAVPLGPPQRYVVVAAPDFLAGRPRPLEPRDLLGQPLIATCFPSGLLPPWEFEKAGQVVKIAPKGPLATQHVGLQIKAAVDGLGFLMTFEADARSAIGDGRLVSLLEDWCPAFAGPLLYYPSRRQPPPALAAFIAFATTWRRQQAGRSAQG
ncbi:LysR family transcriptional regulator [Phreatobacter stygius]|uniref:LysR family transcriptional regulator n=1 Tax=Phreatobacter stygius TaxID=1940610 RepID=A0A4D7B7D1_9HYPH|nr:LysR family transcriptional regulator [Phreatobacter stygius]QCI65576.1 LysR family transcriptional regulator [Phreatobacter stygius]